MGQEKIEAVIFDMDGVLVDTEGIYKIIEQELFRSVGVCIDADEHHAYQGSSNQVMWTLIREKHDLEQSVDELVEMTERKVMELFSSLPGMHPMPGILDLLKYLHDNGVRTALASSSTVDVINIVLDKTGLKPWFRVVADCTEAGAGKPDPAIFLLALRKLGLPPESCMVVEDSVNGIRAAKSAGLRCIAFRGPGSEQQDPSEADLVISSFDEMISLLNPTAGGKGTNAILPGAS